MSGRGHKSDAQVAGELVRLIGSIATKGGGGDADYEAAAYVVHCLRQQHAPRHRSVSAAEEDEEVARILGR